MTNENPPLNETVVSTSLLKRYISCPYSCKLRYVAKYHPQSENDWVFKVGRSGHKILEHFYDNLDLNAPDITVEFKEKLKASAFKHWDRSIDSRKREETEPFFFAWLDYELQRYYHYKKNNCIDRFKPVEVEQDLTDYKGKKRAVVDKRMLGASGIRYVIDYKFNKKLPAQRNYSNILSEIDIEYKIQAAINVSVLKSYGYEIDAFYFQFIRQPEKMISVPLTQQLFNEVENIITSVRLDTEFKKNKKSCFFCDMKMYCNLNESSINCL